ncbi:tripartite tricarboxylate transporter substrate binding protein [Acetobacteraceae bacterium H6797]|nr:tripartite tricarboxylate transporter substrate binding protein [Acetobacteraceae bacterium H6797]
MTFLHRRALLAATAALPLAPRFARAENSWPNKLLRIITPFPAGATSDSAARAIAQILSQKYKQPVVVENRPGAGGGIGAQQALAAQPDGHTLLLVNNSVLTMVPRISQVKFDPVKDFEPVAFLGESYNLLALNRGLPVTDLPGFVALARQKPGALVYASPGVGSYGHVAGALLQQRLGIELLHAPFNGIVPAINAVLAGDAHAVMGPNTVSFVQSGQLRGAVVIGEHRWPDVPEVPTLPEAGVEHWPLDYWYAVVAPAGVPLDIRQRLNADFAEASRLPQVRQLLERVGLRPVELSVDLIGQRIATDWRAVGEAMKLVEIG